jgi:hypothetical protein
VLEFDWAHPDAGMKTVMVRPTQRDSARTFAMPVQVGVDAAGSATPTITTVELSGGSQTLEIQADRRPKRVVLDPNPLVLMEAEFAAAPPEQSSVPTGPAGHAMRGAAAAAWRPASG